MNLNRDSIDDLRLMDPAGDLTDGPLDARALTDLHRMTAQRPARSRRRLVLAAAAVGALAVVAAVAMDRGGAPAYAVTRNDDGTVTIKIERFEDADGLEAAIEKYGVNAEVDYLPWGKTCREPRYTVAPDADQQAAATSVGDNSGDSVLLRPNEFAADETLVIVHSGYEDPSVKVRSFRQLVAKGPVSPCEPVDQRGPR
ncbi:hypothetical protein [Kribbella monticola]|uniref:hypothetical protein n=1 Tax=Kribbella monticola TaxID=2185285 RepID=UPI000DD38E24|nr:hypothetical protein [Kribbella monticola]